MVYYNEPNWISSVSILISLCSVCSKLFLVIYSASDSYQWKFILWLWLCFVIDFLGIFFIVSFAFYTPEIAEYQPYFTMIRNIAFWEFLICIAPFIVGAAIGLFIHWIIALSSDRPWTAICWIPLCTIMMMIGICIAALTMQIFCCWWCGLLVAWLGTADRIPDGEHQQFYADIIDWINKESTEFKDDQNEVMLTKHENKVLKIAIVNHEILQSGWDFVKSCEKAKECYFVIKRGLLYMAYFTDKSFF